MFVFAVVLVSWLLLTLPAAVLMGKCIARGLEPGHAGAAAADVPAQRTAHEDAGERVPAQTGRSQA